MTVGMVNINSCVTSKLPVIKKKLVIIELVADKSLLSKVNKDQCNCLQSVVSLIIYLPLLVIKLQCIVKIGLVTGIFIPNHQSLFFKLTQLAKLSQKNLGKPGLLNFSVHVKVDQVKSINVPTKKSKSHSFSEYCSSHNSSCLINRRCEWTLEDKKVLTLHLVAIIASLIVFVVNRVITHRSLTSPAIKLNKLFTSSTKCLIKTTLMYCPCLQSGRLAAEIFARRFFNKKSRPQHN